METAPGHLAAPESDPKAMSYILDALKKMEHEKARRADSPGMTRISGELFRGDHRPAAAGGVGWKIVLAAVAASLVAVYGTWLVLAPARNPRTVPDSSPFHGKQPAHPPPPVASPSLSPQNAKALPPPPPPAAPGERLPQNGPQPVGSEGSSLRPERKLRRPEVGTATSPRESRAALTMMPAPSGIVVSGIAWQEERRGRRAVINGVLTKEGSVVSGARVAEIRRDRVRFSQSGRGFEVPMAAPGDSGDDTGSAPPNP